MKSIKGVSLALAAAAITPLAFVSAHADHEPDNNFSATFQISSIDGVEKFNVDDPSITIEEFMKSKGLGEDYVPINEGEKEDRKFNDGEQFTVQKQSLTTSSQEIVIKKKTEFKETKDLYVGEKKTASKGKDGKAINVTVYNVGVDENGRETKEETENRLTVTQAPEPEVILVGTKEKKVPHRNAVDSPETVRVGEDEQSLSRDGSTLSELEAARSGMPSSVIDDGTYVAPDVQSDDFGINVLQSARRRIGASYVWAATGPNAYDCSGLTQAVYRENGILLPRRASQQMMAGKIVPQSEARPGDLVYWPGHIGVYAGGNRVVDAGNKSRGVTERKIWGNPVFVTFR